MKSTPTLMDSTRTKVGMFERFSSHATKATGSTPAFLMAAGVVILWAVSGPFFNFSETWQLVINTGTTIITFLMVFLIQKAQNKDSMAIQLKLNELVAAHSHASNRLVDAENISEEELKAIQVYYSKLSELSKKDESLLQSHSIDEAQEAQNVKRKAQHINIKPTTAPPKAKTTATAKTPTGKRTPKAGTASKNTTK